ncbi:MAG: hypothetical protein HYZ25_06255 [Chloroflexi bacterium]|nr:hypothetical protein [Chloroflexota bacterium]
MTTTKRNRRVFLGVQLNDFESAALLLLAEREGLGKSSYARRALLRDFQQAAQSLPADLLTALNIQQAEPLP